MIYIGLMSGTSMDGIDAALVRFGDPGVELLATHSHPYPDTLRHALGKAVMTPPDEPIADLGALDRQVGERFRDAANELLRKSGVDAAEVRAIGSHGQTVRHQPEGPHRYTLQIGNPGIIARGTGIVTVGDFRSADMAAGGQGAPLVPPFHDWLFGGVTTTRVILNIGGIANVTILGAGDVRGFDTGPGNTLLDAWIQRHRKLPLDRGGEWAAAGRHADDLLERLLDHPYFEMEPPKSTGVEEFNLQWLQQFGVDRHEPIDVARSPTTSGCTPRMRRSSTSVAAARTIGTSWRGCAATCPKHACPPRPTSASTRTGSNPWHSRGSRCAPSTGRPEICQV